MRPTDSYRRPTDLYERRPSDFLSREQCRCNFAGSAEPSRARFSLTSKTECSNTSFKVDKVNARPRIVTKFLNVSKYFKVDRPRELDRHETGSNYSKVDKSKELDRYETRSNYFKVDKSKELDRYETGSNYSKVDKSKELDRYETGSNYFKVDKSKELDPQQNSVDAILKSTKTFGESVVNETAPPVSGQASTRSIFSSANRSTRKEAHQRNSFQSIRSASQHSQPRTTRKTREDSIPARKPISDRVLLSVSRKPASIFLNTPVKPLPTPVKPLPTPVKPLPTPVKSLPIPVFLKASDVSGVSSTAKA